MTLQEELIKIILPDFLTYLDKLKKGEIIEKELDNNSIPSIHCNEAEEGVELCRYVKFRRGFAHAAKRSGRWRRSK